VINQCFWIASLRAQDADAVEERKGTNRGAFAAPLPATPAATNYCKKFK
jgi:hypothetical protein